MIAVHAGFIDTDMAALVDAPKISPQSMAGQICDAIEAGQVEVLADERTRSVKASLPRDQELIYPPVQEFWDAALKGTAPARDVARPVPRLARGPPGVAVLQRPGR